MRTQLLKALAISAAVILLIVVGTPLAIFLIINSTPGIKELGPHIDEYINEAGLTDVSDSADPYRVGKLVAVNPYNQQLDPRLQKALPADLRAARDEEVGTIVWVRCVDIPVGQYVEGKYGSRRGRAYRGSCEVTVIDRAAALIVERRTFEAPPPPSTTTSSGDVHSQVDIKDIVQFLADLPAEMTHAPVPNTPPTLVPGSTITVRLTGPDAGIYSTTKAPHCKRSDGSPLNEWEVVDDPIPDDQHSLGHLSFSGRVGDSGVAIVSATTDLAAMVRIGPISAGRTYVVSMSEGGNGTLSIDDRGTSAVITFYGKTASGVFIAWTVVCSDFDTGLVHTTPTPGGSGTDLPSASVNVRSANLRKGPGLNYAVITSLPKGSLLTVLERTGAGDWFRVRANDSGETGWISATVIDLPGDPLEIPLGEE